MSAFLSRRLALQAMESHAVIGHAPCGLRPQGTPQMASRTSALCLSCFVSFLSFPALCQVMLDGADSCQASSGTAHFLPFLPFPAFPACEYLLYHFKGAPAARRAGSDLARRQHAAQAQLIVVRRNTRR